MSALTAKNDATPSTRGTLHQLWVAVQKCYEMHEPGQRIYIETKGDVSGEDQIEVKQYSDPLTDNHLNFWKTLRNWVDDDFNPTQFHSLILLTTQPFGVSATIAEWNSKSPEERRQILSAIRNQNETRQNAKQKGATNGKASPPYESLRLQRYVLAESRKSKLDTVLQISCIEARSDRTPELYARIKGQYVKGVLDGKKDDFLGALFAFITQPTNDGDLEWEITFEAFSGKVQELVSQYCRETRIFPVVSIEISDDELDNRKKNHLFVQKILDIQYDEVVRSAVEHYLSAINTVNREFQSHSVSQVRVERYVEELVQQFMAQYRKASRNCSDVIKDSQDLYDDQTACSPQVFSGFDSTPMQFRNGLLHAEMDDERAGLKWRLEKP